MFLFMSCVNQWLYPVAMSRLVDGVTSASSLPATVQSFLTVYQQHNALVVYSLKFFVAEEYTGLPNVDKLMLTVLPAENPVNVSLSGLCTAVYTDPCGACST